MQTPDGKEFEGSEAPKVIGAAAHALLSAVMALLRAVGKLIMTTWRLAAALDSALWRATKLILRKTVNGLAYGFGLSLAAFRYVLLWLPTRFGRAYSAISGVMLVLAVLWMVDELRAGPGFDAAGQSVLRPPVDEQDPILARIEGRYVHLSEIEAAARAGGFLRESERLTPKSAFQRELVESYVEQRLLARAALDEGMQRAPTVLRRVNAARDRVLAASFMESKIDEAVTPETVERLYKSQADVTKLGDEVKARLIIVETGVEAEEIMTLLAGGADFGALARERSIDRSTAPHGGEMGWFVRAMMTKAISNVAFATTPGEVSPPFQTQYGWNIIEVLGRRGTNAVPFSDVENRIEDFLRLRTIETTLDELEEARQVVYFRPEEDEQRQASPPPPDLSAPGSVEPDAPGDEETLD